MKALLKYGLILVCVLIPIIANSKNVRKKIREAVVCVYSEEQSITGHYNKEIATKWKDVSWSKEITDPETGVTHIETGIYKEPIEWKTIQAPKREHSIIGQKTVDVYKIMPIAKPPKKGFMERQ